MGSRRLRRVLMDGGGLRPGRNWDDSLDSQLKCVFNVRATHVSVLRCRRRWASGCCAARRGSLLASARRRLPACARACASAPACAQARAAPPRPAQHAGGSESVSAATPEAIQSGVERTSSSASSDSCPVTTPPAGENTTARSDAPASSRAWRRPAAFPALPPAGPAPSAPALRTPRDAATASSAPGAGSSPPGSVRRKRATRPESASRVVRGPAAPPSRGGADSVSCRLPVRRFCLLLMASPLLTPLLTASALRTHAACQGGCESAL